MRRQLNDPYVMAAQRDGYRARAAYKLAQLDEKFHFLVKGARIVDLGAAPGSWSQLAAQKLGASGQIVALDILPMEPLPHVTVLEGDFLSDEIAAQLSAALGGQADVVMSDMASPTTGHTPTDHLQTLSLAEAAYAFAETHLGPGGTFICKLFQGGDTADLLKILKRDFDSVKHVKPAASRKESPELFIVATGFRKLAVGG